MRQSTNSTDKAAQDKLEETMTGKPKHVCGNNK